MRAVWPRARASDIYVGVGVACVVLLGAGAALGVAVARRSRRAENAPRAASSGSKGVVTATTATSRLLTGRWGGTTVYGETSLASAAYDTLGGAPTATYGATSLAVE